MASEYFKNVTFPLQLLQFKNFWKTTPHHNTKGSAIYAYKKCVGSILYCLILY